MTAAETRRIGAWVPGLVLLGVLVAAPFIPEFSFADGKVFFFGDGFVQLILTKMLWLGVAALSLIFLAGYGGMVSLAQVALYGIAGFVMGNVVQADGGLDMALNPWLGVVIGILFAVIIGFLLGAISARSEGIYFLMITLAFAVLTFFFWGAVTQLSGFGGVNNIAKPELVRGPNNLYYTALIVAVFAYLLIRYVIRTPFGIGLQGVRDEPTRMRALGYDVALHRTIAFTFGAFIAALSGILSVWWNTRIDPNSINLQATLDVLVIAVVGGLFRLAGAFIGAFVFVAIEIYVKNFNFERFNTLIGSIFLVIVLLSPGGLLGIWDTVRTFVKRTRGGEGEPVEASPERS